MVTCILLGVRVLAVLAVAQYCYTRYVRKNTTDMTATVERKVEEDGDDFDENGKS